MESPKQTKIRLTTTNRITRVKRTQEGMTRISTPTQLNRTETLLLSFFVQKSRRGHILQRDSRAVKGCYLFVGLTAGVEAGLYRKNSRQRGESLTHDPNICYVYQHRWESLGKA